MPERQQSGIEISDDQRCAERGAERAMLPAFVLGRGLAAGSFDLLPRYDIMRAVRRVLDNGIVSGRLEASEELSNRTAVTDRDGTAVRDGSRHEPNRDPGARYKRKQHQASDSRATPELLQ